MSNFLQTISGGTSTSGRLGHRKSSLALTPEEEPLDTSTVRFKIIKFIDFSIIINTFLMSNCKRIVLIIILKNLVNSMIRGKNIYFVEEIAGN